MSVLLAAIILIAIIYYYSPPMGSKTWMKALVYPFSTNLLYKTLGTATSYANANRIYLTNQLNLITLCLIIVYNDLCYLLSLTAVV
jgi:hypothetical protein